MLLMGQFTDTTRPAIFIRNIITRCYTDRYLLGIMECKEYIINILNKHLTNHNTCMHNYIKTKLHCWYYVQNISTTNTHTKTLLHSQKFFDFMDAIMMQNKRHYSCFDLLALGFGTMWWCWVWDGGNEPKIENILVPCTEDI